MLFSPSSTKAMPLDSDRMHDVTSDPVAGLDLPPEVSLAKAASIANCDKKTIIRYMRDGLLEWRNIAPPSSSRPTYRVTLMSVVALRMNYQHGSAARDQSCDGTSLNIPQMRKRTPSRHHFKHVWLNRS
jgi:hypothetical protein